MILRYSLLPILLFFCLAPVYAAENRRIAMVIGNNAYQHLKPLANSGRDAVAVAEKLAGLGFTLINAKGKPGKGAVRNLDEDDFVQAIARFSRAAQGAEIAFFYYAGHGMQFSGNSYLLPVDLKRTDIDLMQRNSIGLEEVLTRLDGKAALNVAVFDACREIPEMDKVTRSAGINPAAYRGLARVKSKGRSRIVAYAGAAGQLVDDGHGGHSPYTEVLLKHLDTPAMEVGDLFRTVAYQFGRRYAGQDPEVLIQGVPPMQFYLRKKSAKEPVRLKTGDIWTEPETGMEFVFVKTGCFQMGQSKEDKRQLIAERGQEKYDKYYKHELPWHQVCVDGFWLGKYEVTNRQFRRFRSSHDSKEYKGKSLNKNDQPVVEVSWEDARDYASWLGRKSGKTMRLPTEAEWEYAARGGTSTVRFWGNAADDACKYANVYDQTSKRVIGFGWEHHSCDDGYAVTAPVGSFRANFFGLYDMLGNVWEWCSDWYSEDYYASGSRNNPQDASSGSRRVIRGGCWNDGPAFVRSADRFRVEPPNRSHNLGFRLAFVEGSR